MQSHDVLRAASMETASNVVALRAPARAVRLVLCLMVKNEEKIIGRCLRAALPIVDGCVVCDTGSSDATVDVARQAVAALDVPCRIAHHDWRSFGENRTRAAREAADWVAERGWPAAETYLLFLDADMILHVGPRFDRASLTATSYDVAQDDGGLRYYNTRLGCLSHVWRSIGVTHEYWEPQGDPPTAARLDTIWIQDVGDGGSKADKTERDIRLLTDGLRAEPDNNRYAFYLAQSLFDAGRFAEAAEWYGVCWRKGSWPEERWYAHYRRGLCLLEMGEAERAAGAGVLLAAFQERPTRAEPLHALARHYRERGQSHLALMLARTGLEIPYPVDDVLFIAKPVYEWRLWEEVMISAYYAGERHRDLGFSACERLITARGHEPWLYDYFARNESFYVGPAPARRRGTFSVSPERRLLGTTEYACANPGIVDWRGRTYVNVRLVNYAQERGRAYRSGDADGVIRTRNVIVEWDPARDRAGGEREASTGPLAAWPADTAIRGLEDVRLAVYEDRVWFTATSCQVPGSDGLPRVVLGRMNEAMDAVEHLVGLDYDGARGVEKNWVLWPRDGELHAIYSYDPLVVLRIDPGSGRARAVLSRTPPFFAGRWRGSAPPIRTPGAAARWVTLIHEAAYLAEETVYTHRWIELDGSGAITSYSPPFTFEHRGIEYASGLCASGTDGVIVTYGCEDREARWVELGWSDVLAAIGRAS